VFASLRQQEYKVLPAADIARQVAAIGGKIAGNDLTPPAVAAKF